MCCLKIMSRDILCTLGIPHSNANEETIFKVHLSIKLPLGFVCLLWISILVDIFITTRIMSWIHMTFIKGISQVQLMYFIIYKMYVLAFSIYVRERKRGREKYLILGYILLSFVLSKMMLIWHHMSPAMKTIKKSRPNWTSNFQSMQNNFLLIY